MYHLLIHLPPACDWWGGWDWCGCWDCWDGRPGGGLPRPGGGLPGPGGGKTGGRGSDGAGSLLPVLARLDLRGKVAP
ncbi:MAG: hypothetical protein ACYDAQ_09600, partial [Mycobacteriales bacterium]